MLPNEAFIHKTKIGLMKNLIWNLIALLALIMLSSSCNDDSDFLDNDNFAEELAIEGPTVHNKKTCGHDHHMQELLSDPVYKAAYDKRMEKHKHFLATNVGTRALCSSLIKVPVAIHYQGANSNDLTCLVALAVEQVAALNADYQGTNSDISNWTNNASSSFPSITHGETCLEFVLADTNHPSGYGLTNGDLAVTRNATTGDSDPSWAGYLNIFVKNAGGALGYSPLGGSGNGDGVVVDLGAFGIANSSCGNVGANAPYNLGRTLTHEVGHYLLLDHILSLIHI